MKKKEINIKYHGKATMNFHDILKYLEFHYWY